MFYSGQKVVCVDNGPSKFGLGLKAPELKKGETYTILKCWHHERSQVLAVTLFEVDPSFGYDAFDARRFRPAVDRPTSIAVFKKMLTPHTQDA